MDGGMQGVPGATGAGERPPPGSEAAEIDELANAYFQKIYTSDITIPEVINLLKTFKNSSEHKEQEIFRCMIHNLFDEYRFFHKYPEKELQVTGRLFGALIQHQLVSSITLGIALRYVLEALRKDPEQGGINEKMFRFGMISLEQFRSRLAEWPQYCTHLLQIVHLGRHCPELFAESQRAINNPTLQQGSTDVNSLSPLIVSQSSELPPSLTQHQESIPQSLTDCSQFVDQVGAMPLVAEESSGLLSDQAASSRSPMLRSLQNRADTAPPPVSIQLPPGSVDQTTSGALADAGGTSTGINAVPLVASSSSELLSSFDSAGGSTEIDRMGSINVDSTNAMVPPESVRDQIHFIVNNIAKSNAEAKSAELKQLLHVDHYHWFANYLVVKRISTQPNLHPLYLMMLDTILSEELSKALIDSVYHNVTKLLQSSKITTSSSERSLLRNLGSWLGQVTLARSKPLLARRINLKELLFWGYESGRLIAVCSFVAKILDGIRDSKVFRPPNPWITAILGVLRELFELEDLKMNIKFEVQVLCKNVNIKIEDIPRTYMLTTRRIPIKEQNPDFNVKPGSFTPASPQMKTASPPTNPLQGPSQDVQASNPMSAAAESLLSEQTVIPNLASYVQISPSLHFFAKFPSHRRIVALAVDRAIREIIQPVVERSVTISCVTTKQLVLKDYALEPNETQLRNAAHLMISNLAGSLALVTCKEPLRISIGNHLRSLLSHVTNDQTAIEEIIQVCSNENLDLGCILIEKAATEKAIRDIDESLASSIQARRKHRETGQPFVDSSDILKGSRYPRELPEMLKPKAGGLHPQQALVYEGFQRQRSQQPLVQQHESPAVSSSMTNSPSLQGMQLPPSTTQAVPATLNMSQALEACQKCLGRVDAALAVLLQQTQGREITLSMLNADNEIIAIIRDMIMIIQRTQTAVRLESAMTFAERVFKRLVETVTGLDTLRVEVFIGILEALREACAKVQPGKFSPDIMGWLNLHASFNVSEENGARAHRSVLVALLRSKLVRSQDVDF